MKKESRIVFIKPMDKYPGNESLELNIPAGTEFALGNTDLIQARVNNSFMAGTTFISANTVINAGYAKVINS